MNNVYIDVAYLQVLLYGFFVLFCFYYCLMLLCSYQIAPETFYELVSSVMFSI